MKKIYFWIFSLLGFLWLFGSVLAQTEFDPMNMPALTEYVEDFSNVLTDANKSELRGIAYDYFSGTSTQIATVLFPYRQGNELIDIGVNYFNDNGIGQKNNNNGLLLLISTEEKKLRIVVWYGLEWAIPDLEARKIVDALRPYVNEGQYYEAVKLFYEMSISAIDHAGDVFVEDTSLDEISTGIAWWAWVSIVNLLVLFWGVIYGFYLPFRKKRAIPEKVKKFFGGEKKSIWKMFLWIVASYAVVIIVLVSMIDVLDSIPFVANISAWFFPAFLFWFLLALMNWESMKWWSGGWSLYSGYRSSSSSFGSFSSSSSSSSSRGFSGGGGSTWWGWAGD